MPPEKPWYASKTVWGAALAIVSGFVPVVGTVLAIPEVNTTAVDALSGLGSVIGGAIATYGRINATTQITGG